MAGFRKTGLLAANMFFATDCGAMKYFHEKVFLPHPPRGRKHSHADGQGLATKCLLRRQTESQRDSVHPEKRGANTFECVVEKTRHAGLETRYGRLGSLRHQGLPWFCRFH